MDTIPVQEIPAQQISSQPVPVQPAETLIPAPIQKPPAGKVSLKKILNLGTWVILFTLLPITVLIFLSQNSLPGDLFYPVKRGLEGVVLAAASVNPVTRAAFRTDLTEARFKEAQSLVISKSNASGLSTFIAEVQAAKFEVTNLKSDAEREKVEEKLTAKIQEYQNGLSALEAKTQKTIIAYQFQEALVPTSIPPTSAQTLIPTSTPIPLPSSKQEITPTLIFTPTSISLTSAPPIAPNVSFQQDNAQISEQRRIAQTLKETKEKLSEIEKDLKEKRIEMKEKRERKNESERKDKGDEGKKDNSD